MASNIEDSRQERLNKEILAKLRELGGEQPISGDVQRGPKLVLPFDMKWSEVETLAAQKAAEEEEYTVYQREYRFKPWDVAYAATVAMRKYFGTLLHGGSFWNPAAMITVNSGPNETVQIPWGEFEVPTLPGCTIQFGGKRDKENGLVGMVMVTGPNKLQKEINALFDLIGLELTETSLYRGKAFDGAEQPNFLDTSLDESRIVFSKEVQRHLDANILSPLRITARNRELGLKLKRAFLLSGEFGVGKTLAIKLAQKVAVENGWTVISVRVAEDNIEDAIRTATQYGPSLVTVEDIDLLANADLEANAIARMLEVFDGAQTKGREVMLVMSTNYKERLPKGMLRPGRLDKVIEVGLPDAEGIRRLIESNLPAQVELSEDIDWKAVADANEGYIPAFVVEGAEAAVRYTIARTGGELDGKMDTEDLIAAANGLRSQWHDYHVATTETANYALDNVVRNLMDEHVEKTLDKVLIPQLLKAIEQREVN